MSNLHAMWYHTGVLSLHRWTAHVLVHDKRWASAVEYTSSLPSFVNDCGSFPRRC